MSSRKSILFFILILAFCCRTSLLQAGTADEVRTAYDARRAYQGIEILQPFDGALFPADIAAPEFIWMDVSGAKRWLITLDFGGSKPLIEALTDEPRWIPEKKDWESVKAHSLESKAETRILGFVPDNPARIVSKGSLAFSTSKDEVGDPLLYQQVPLPFVFARDNPSKMRFRMGRVSDYDPPESFLENRNDCGNCHTLTSFRKGKSPKSFGLFPVLSPDGSVEAGEVHVRSLTVPLSDIRASEFVYHITGRIAFYGEKDEKFTELPGASDPDFVQTHPFWSPDGKYVYFSRAPVKKQLLGEYAGKDGFDAEVGTVISDMNKKFPVKYDICRVPFNKGKGGKPEPVMGASANEMSNCFPRISPDGKWMVFTGMESGFVLQPSGSLFIVPAEGGEARKMRCNLPVWNSYHNFTTNGKWLVFTSKGLSPYTQLFMTHIDENGVDSTPVLLWRFHDPGYAAVVPHFLEGKP
jgi:hypothetical protein